MWRRKPKKDKHFKDGRTRLANKSNLRRFVFERSGGYCENIIDGDRCNQFAPWDGPFWIKGDLCHREHGQGRRDDTPEGTYWGCHECHYREHNPKACPVGEWRKNSLDKGNGI